MFPIEFGVQRSSALVIEVEMYGFHAIEPYPPRVKLSYRWTTHGRKMFPIEFGVQRSSALDIKVEILYGFRAL
jgi:hypothetical protein